MTPLEDECGEPISIFTPCQEHSLTPSFRPWNHVLQPQLRPLFVTVLHKVTKRRPSHMEALSLVQPLARHGNVLVDSGRPYRILVKVCDIIVRQLGMWTPAAILLTFRVSLTAIPCSDIVYPFRLLRERSDKIVIGKFGGEGVGALVAFLYSPIPRVRIHRHRSIDWKSLFCFSVLKNIMFWSMKILGEASIGFVWNLLNLG